ncbi:MAG: hypothetical protein QM811_13900 [Pirellulales bacterium]
MFAYQPAGASEPKFYDVNEKLEFTAVDGKKYTTVVAETKAATEKAAEKSAKADPTPLVEKLKYKVDYKLDDASVIVQEDKGIAFRLPRGQFKTVVPAGSERTVREAVSERYLANIQGTFFEIPRAEGAGKEHLDWRHIKPVTTHNRAIADFGTWRWPLGPGRRRRRRRDRAHVKGTGDAKLWFGAIDDLWKFGKPTGEGGPWKDSAVTAKTPSDPYLMTNYDKKTLTFKHDAKTPVKVTVELDLANNGSWRVYESFEVAPNSTFKHEFPAGFQAHWVRFTTDRDCQATAWLTYE